MSREKRMGIIVKYSPFIGLLILYVVFMCRDIITIESQIERSVAIWTNILKISAIIGVTISVIVLAKFDLSLTGETSNIVSDFINEKSANFAVKFNGVIAAMIFVMVSSILAIIYTFTKNQLFLSLSKFILNSLFACQVVGIIAVYLKIKNSCPNTVYTKVSNPIFLPMIICMIQFFTIKEKRVETVFYNICFPQNDVCLILSISFVLLYFLSIAYCHFSNIYCLIGFTYLKKDIVKIKERIDRIQKKDEKREKELRHTARKIDQKAMQSGLIRKFGLAIYFFLVHMKAYIQEVFYAVFYLMAYLSFKTTKRLSKLLEPERIRINNIRFCWITLVLELLSLDLILFIHLEGDDPCLKFFELVSTVVIIPVLLSWLAELKIKKNVSQ